MKNLQSKLKPVLKKEGVFYPSPHAKDIKRTIILKKIDREARFTESHLNNEGRVLGFGAYHKLTGDSYYHNALVSKKIGEPGIHIITDNDESVDYASDLELALDKAHEYLFNKIIEEDILECDGAYTNLLDMTKTGLEKFNKNKANLSEDNLKTIRTEESSYLVKLRDIVIAGSEKA